MKCEHRQNAGHFNDLKSMSSLDYRRICLLCATTTCSEKLSADSAHSSPRSHKAKPCHWNLRSTPFEAELLCGTLTVAGAMRGSAPNRNRHMGPPLDLSSHSQMRTQQEAKTDALTEVGRAPLSTACHSGSARLQVVGVVDQLARLTGINHEARGKAKHQALLGGRQ